MEPLQMNEKTVPELPENWVWTTLGECVDILDRKRIPINAKERAERKGNIPYYGATGQVGWIDDYLFDEELVLLGEDGAPFFDSTKNTAYIIRGKSWVNNHAHVLRAIFGVTLNQFLCNYLNNFNYQGYVTGTTRHKLNQSQMKIIPLPIPPLPEQHRIVTKIEGLFTQLDAGVGALTKAKAQLKRYRQSVLKSACEGRLVPSEAELARADGRDYEPADVLLARIGKERRKQWEAEKKRKGKKSAKYEEPAAPDVGDLPELPEGWCWVSLDQLIVHILAGKSFKCEEKPPDRNEIGVVKVSAVTWGEFNESESKTCKNSEMIRDDFLIGEGDFLFSRANTIELVGACVIVKQISKRLMLSDKILRFGFAVIPPKWVLVNLRTVFGRSEIERLATGNQDSMRNIGQDRIRQIRIPLPPLIEQHRIVAEIERRLSVADETEKTIDQNLKQAERLRQSILKKAFEGKLVPQNPNDEPAKKLLERIKQEKTKIKVRK